MKIDKMRTIIWMMFICLLLALSAQAAMKPSPDQAIQMLKEGNRRLVEGKSIHPHTGKNRLYQAGTQNQAATQHIQIKPAVVKLADAQTLQILSTDWLKAADEAHQEALKTGLSGSFWTIMAIVGALVVLGLVLFFGGTFKRFSINHKLYVSYGSLVLLALILGVAGYAYVTGLNRTAHLETAFLDLDMMASEMAVAQNEFLLYGIENKAYGETQVARINAVLEAYAQDIDAIKGTHHFDADLLPPLEKISTLVGTYKEGLVPLVKAFHLIEEDKEKLDELGKETDEALEKMTHHHQTELARLESQGTDMGEIRYQTQVIEHLSQVEILSLKVAHNEVEFLLDKNVDRVAAMEKEMGLLKGYLEALEHELRARQEKDLLKKIGDKIEEYAALLKDLIHAEAVVEKNAAEMKALIHEIEAIGAGLSHKLEVKADGMQREAIIAMVVLIGIALLAGTLLSIFIARSISLPIKRSIEGLDEGAEQVASASGQVSTASQTLAEGASEQAASIEETSSSLEEISSMTRQNAGNANRADAMMKEANQVVSSANDAMGELTHSMEDISKASEETSRIIKTIDEIAFQTNLLALNAAVEAARAGEAGAGFAVVADEVRNLAMRAAEAAKSTADLIEGTVKKVNGGGDLVSRTNEAFTEVAASTKKVGELVGEIAAASNEQAQGIGQVNTAVTEVDKVTQQNAASAEESASASEEMSAQAEQMRGIVRELGTLVGGANGHTDRHSATDVLKTKQIKDVLHLPPKKQTTKSERDPALISHKTSPETVIPFDEDFENF